MKKERIFTLIVLISIGLLIIIMITKSKYYKDLKRAQYREEYREKVLKSPFSYIREGTYKTTEELTRAKVTFNKFGVSEIKYSQYDQRIIDFEFTSRALIIDYPYEWQDLTDDGGSVQYSRAFENKKYSHVQEIIKFNPIFTRLIPRHLDDSTTTFKIEIEEWYVLDMKSGNVILDVLNTNTNEAKTLTLYCHKYYDGEFRGFGAITTWGIDVKSRLYKHAKDVLLQEEYQKSTSSRKRLMGYNISESLKFRGFMTLDAERLYFENGKAYHNNTPDYHQKSRLEEW